MIDRVTPIRLDVTKAEDVAAAACGAGDDRWTPDSTEGAAHTGHRPSISICKFA
jgi:hypothetical protein